MNPRLLELLVKENRLTQDQRRRPWPTSAAPGAAGDGPDAARLHHGGRARLPQPEVRHPGDQPRTGRGRPRHPAAGPQGDRPEVPGVPRPEGREHDPGLSDPTVVLAIDDVQFATGAPRHPRAGRRERHPGGDRPQHSSDVDDIQEAHRSGVHRRRHQSRAGRQAIEVDLAELGRGRQGPDDPVREPDRRRRHPEAPRTSTWSRTRRSSACATDRRRAPRHDEPAQADGAGHPVARQDHGEPRHRGAAPPPGRPALREVPEPRDRPARLVLAHDLRREDRRVWTRAASSWTSRASASRRTISPGSRRPSPRPTG